MKLQIILQGYLPLPTDMDQQLVRAVYSRQLLCSLNLLQTENDQLGQFIRAQILPQIVCQLLVRGRSRTTSRLAAPLGDPRGVPKLLSLIVGKRFNCYQILGLLEGFRARISHSNVIKNTIIISTQLIGRLVSSNKMNSCHSEMTISDRDYLLLEDFILSSQFDEVVHQIVSDSSLSIMSNNQNISSDKDKIYGDNSVTDTLLTVANPVDENFEDRMNCVQELQTFDAGSRSGSLSNRTSIEEPGSIDSYSSNTAISSPEVNTHSQPDLECLGLPSQHYTQSTARNAPSKQNGAKRLRESDGDEEDAYRKKLASNKKACAEYRKNKKIREQKLDLELQELSTRHDELCQRLDELRELVNLYQNKIIIRTIPRPQPLIVKLQLI